METKLKLKLFTFNSLACCKVNLETFINCEKDIQNKINNQDMEEIKGKIKTNPVFYFKIRLKS